MVLRFISNASTSYRAGGSEQDGRADRQRLRQSAESFLIHKEKLKTLSDAPPELAAVRAYIEESLDPDLGLHDPARLHLILRGLIAFCRLGLHRQGNSGDLSLTAEEDAFLAADSWKMGEAHACRMRELINRGVRLDLFDINTLAFEKAVHSLEIFLRCGLHRSA